MSSFKTTFATFLFITAVAGCSPKAPTGQACLGNDADSLVEGLGSTCKAGDTIATKNPAYFCNFSYAIAYNSYNSAFCIYSGGKSETRSQ